MSCSQYPCVFTRLSKRLGVIVCFVSAAFFNVTGSAGLAFNENRTSFPNSEIEPQLGWLPTEPSICDPATNPQLLINATSKDTEIRELSGGEIHTFSILMQEGDFCRVTLVQLGIDIVVTLLAHDGKRVTVANSPNGPTGPESIAF